MTSADKPGQRTWFVGGDDEKPQADHSGNTHAASSGEGTSSLADEVFGKDDIFSEDEPTGPIFSSFATGYTPENTHTDPEYDNVFASETRSEAQADTSHAGVAQSEPASKTSTTANAQPTKSPNGEHTTESDSDWGKGNLGDGNWDAGSSISEDAASGKSPATDTPTNGSDSDATPGAHHTEGSDDTHAEDTPGGSPRLFSSDESSSLEHTAAMTAIDLDDDDPANAPADTKDNAADGPANDDAGHASDEFFDSNATSPAENAATAEPSETISDTSPERARQSVVEQLHTPISDDDELESTLVHRQSLLKDADTSPSDNEKTEDAQASNEPEWKSTADAVKKDDAKRVLPSAVDEAIFEGATVRPAVPSRAGAHLWSFVLFLLLVPVTWYLTWDAGTRLTLAKNAQWDTGVIDPLALSELGAGALCLFVLILVARWSSLGAFIMGIATLGCGVPFVVLPAVTQQRLTPVLESLHNAGPFTGNIAHHLEWSGSTGFFILAGVAMISLGFVSHGARRKGRKDFLTKRRVEREKRKQGIKD